MNTVKCFQLQSGLPVQFWTEYSTLHQKSIPFRKLDGLYSPLMVNIERQQEMPEDFILLDVTEIVKEKQCIRT